MFDKVTGAWNALKAGQAVYDAIKLKRAQIGVSVGSLVVSLVVLAKSFGVDLPISTDDAMQLGAAFGVVFGLFNHYATAASTDKIDALGRTDAAAFSGATSTGNLASMGSSDAGGSASGRHLRAISDPPAVQRGSQGDTGPANGPQDFTRDSNGG